MILWPFRVSRELPLPLDTAENSLESVLPRGFVFY